LLLAALESRPAQMLDVVAAKLNGLLITHYNSVRMYLAVRKNLVRHCKNVFYI
jgi:hypothetical protein